MAVVLAAVLLPAATVALHPSRPIVSLQTILLTYLLIAVLVAFVGGALPGVIAAVAGFFLANWYFTPPFRTWTVDDPENLLGLVAFLVVASSVGLLVGAATRRAGESQRARAQVEALAVSASTFDPAEGFDPIVSNIRAVFGADTVTFLERTDEGWTVRASAGPALGIDPLSADQMVSIDDDRMLALDGVKLGPDDRRVLAAFAVQARDALERERLRQEAARVEAMTETDRLRAALLGAVSHDLRTPLASIKASVTSLVETGIEWSPEQTRSFLNTIHTETERLNRLVGQLLDAGRIEVGAVDVTRRRAAPDELVSSALASLSVPIGRVEVDVPETLPLVDTDAVLFERVLANLADNALNHSPDPLPVVMRAFEEPDHVLFEIVDHGPGIPAHLRNRVFQPFQRFGDGDTSTGVGLGLAVTRGFLDALDLRLSLHDTDGGGTTVRIPLPKWSEPRA